jgi:hypothetical protein
LREAVLLGKARRLSTDYYVNTMVQGACDYTGIEQMDFVDGARTTCSTERKQMAVG